MAARTVAAHALSIFGDHSDVMACRQTGFAMFCSGSVQEAHDFAAIAHAATLESRVPFLHFFDGFRTSHEIAKIEELNDDDLRRLISEDKVREHRERAPTPDRPVLRGTAQNPDVFFQARESANRLSDACPAIVENMMERFAALTGRRYRLFDYVGDSGAGAPDRDHGLWGRDGRRDRAVPHRAGRESWRHQGQAVPAVLRGGVVAALPSTTRSIAVLDRTKEPGAVGDPLYLDVVTALAEARADGKLSLAAEMRAPQVVMACRRRNSRRPWLRQSSTSSRKQGRATTSPLGLSTM